MGGAGSGLIYGSSGVKGNGIYMRSGNSRVDQKEEFQMTSTANDVVRARESGDDLALRAAEREIVISGPQGKRRDDEESVESAGSEKMIIRTTKNWSVRYEER